MTRLVLAIVALTSVATAGILDQAIKGTTTDYADFFANQFKGVQDLIPQKQSDLGLNINRVKDLLTAVGSKAKFLEPLANDAQKQTLRSVSSFAQEIGQFGNKVARDGGRNFNENKSMWETLAGKVFTTGGMMQLLPLLLNGTPNVSLIVAAVLPIFLAVFRL